MTSLLCPNDSLNLSAHRNEQFCSLIVMPDSSVKLEQIISSRLGESMKILRVSPVSGGSINRCFRIETEKKRIFFCKTNSWSAFPGLFEKEKSGLQMLGGSGLVRVPSIISCDREQDLQLLILEWIDQKSPGNSCFEKFGAQLAALHGLTQAKFGLSEDNYVGSIPQSNRQHALWSTFFIEERLRPLLEMAIRKKLLRTENIPDFECVFSKIPGIFDEQRPCLVHGDLWSGNFLCTEDDQPLLIDPACYFGHRSMDLAMTTLFGGFEKNFYEAYNHHYSFPSNYQEQWQVCNLYPLLIHLNLFGSGYLGSILEIVNRFK